MGKNRDFSKFPNAITVLDSGYVLIGAIASTGAGTNRLQITGTTSSQLLVSNTTSTGHIALYSTGVDAYITKNTASGTMYFGLAPQDGSSFTSQMTITSAGNVGIGTSSPTAISGFTSVCVNNATTGGFFEAQQGGTVLSRYGAQNDISFIDTVANIPFIIKTNSTERMRITSAGNVGIGTTSPNGLLQLGNLQSGGQGSINGASGTINRAIINCPYPGASALTLGYYSAGYGLDIWVNGDGTGLAPVYIDQRQNEAIIFRRSTYGTAVESMRIQSGGNVGIGNSAPLSALTVTRTNAGGRGGEISITNEGATAGTEAALNFGFGTSSYNGDAGNAQIKAVFTGGNEITDLVFTTWTGGGFTEKMRILGDGSIGIGTSSPSVKLQVNGIIYGQKQGGTNSTPAFQVRGAGGGPRIQTYGLDADGQAWMGLGTDMAGNPYEHSVYFSAPSNGAGRVTFGAYDGTTYSLKMTIARDGSIGAPNGTNIYNPSDGRLKKNIVTITNGLDKIMALNPVKFNWIEGFSSDEQGKNMLGFIAQEVEEIIPEAVESFSDGSSLIVGETTIENLLRVNEKFIIPVLVKAIQELKAEIQELKNQ